MAQIPASPERFPSPRVEHFVVNGIPFPLALTYVSLNNEMERLKKIVTARPLS